MYILHSTIYDRLLYKPYIYINYTYTCTGIEFGWKVSLVWPGIREDVATKASASFSRMCSACGGLKCTSPNQYSMLRLVRMDSYAILWVYPVHCLFEFPRSGSVQSLM